MMEGFFEEIGVIETKSERKTKVFTCEDCKLNRGCISPKMPTTGEGKKKILIVAEAPGKEEDMRGIQLIGKAGQILRDVLDELGLDLDEDFWKTNALICRPPNNRTPANKEITACRRNLFSTIDKYKPRAIIPMGRVALESLLGERIRGKLPGVSFSDWVGERIPDQELGIWVCPVYHPSYIMRMEWDKVLRRMWKENIKKAIEVSNTFVVHDYSSDVFVTEEKKEAIEWIRSLGREAEIASFDYETTGRKPHRKGHKILSVSFSNGEEAWAFPFFEDENFRNEWKKWLMSDIKKVAHNYRFEKLWSEEILKCDVRNWFWDTKLYQHCLYNNKNSSLKFLVYVNFGILGYDSRVVDYMGKSGRGENGKSCNAFNCLNEAPLEGLLKYNGLDSLFTYKMFEKQCGSMNERREEGFRLFMEGADKLANAQQTGICLDLEKLNVKKLKVGEKLKKLENRIKGNSALEKWDGKEEFDFNSNKQLSHLLFDILKLKVRSRTPSGAPSVDKKALEKIVGNSLVDDILEYRRWYKLINTYIPQYEREQVEGVIHPFFNLSTVSTFRSSSNAPNFQNVPIRDSAIKRIIRSIIVPREGNRLIGWDYKAIEVCVAACYNKDPNLIEYVKDSSKDMHRDMAAELFLKNVEEVTKEERYIAKNGFVFPEFYGSYFEQTAPDLWKRMSKDTANHLRKKGIEGYKDFEYHVKKVEERFWEKKFSKYSEWKKRTFRKYEKRGYVETYTGFRCYGPMKRNEVLNYQIQGSAFHCLLWTFIQVEKKVNELDKSFLVGQIHDEIVGDVNPEDEGLFDSLIFDYGTRKIREYWDWIIVPLRIEKERSEVDGNWSKMEDCGYLK